MQEFTADGQYTLEQLESTILFQEAKSFELSYIAAKNYANRIGFSELPLGTFPDEIKLTLIDQAPSDFKINKDPYEVYVVGKLTKIWIARRVINDQILSINRKISDIQKELKIENDGLAGPETWSAISTALGLEQSDNHTAAVDPRSTKNILTLLPEVRPYAISLISSSAKAGISIKIISALRTYAEQDELYAQGRTKPGLKVTNAKGGHSNHNFGIAFDIGVFEGRDYLERSNKYKAVGALGLQLGLEWGGNWKSIVDEPHFQLRPSWAKALDERAMLVELRQRTADGKSVYA